MKVTAKLHYAIAPYCFIEKEYILEEGQEFINKMIIEDYNNLSSCVSAMSKTADEPSGLGQTYTDEYGHTYKSARNEKTGKFFWMIDRA